MLSYWIVGLFTRLNVTWFRCRLYTTDPIVLNAVYVTIKILIMQMYCIRRATFPCVHMHIRYTLMDNVVIYADLNDDELLLSVESSRLL